MVLPRIIMIPRASVKAAPARIMCIDAVSPTSCKPMALLEDVWIVIVSGSTILLRKSARPILKTSNWMSHKVRPSARQARTCLLLLPASWPPEAGRRPPRCCAAIRAASLASQMRIFNPQLNQSKNVEQPPPSRRLPHDLSRAIGSWRQRPPELCPSCPVEGHRMCCCLRPCHLVFLSRQKPACRLCSGRVGAILRGIGCQKASQMIEFLCRGPQNQHTRPEAK